MENEIKQPGLYRSELEHDACGIGAFVLMELITHIAPAIVPLPFSCYFDFFDGLLQAYVFVLLTSLFISESIE